MLAVKAHISAPLDCSHPFLGQNAAFAREFMNFQQHALVELETVGTIKAWGPGLNDSKLIFALHHIPAS